MMINLRSVILSLIILFLIFLITIPVRYVLRLQRRKKRLLKYVGHLPSPKELPIVGSGLRFVWKNSEEVMKDSIDFVTSNKTPFYAWVGRYLTVVLDKPDDAFTVLTSKSCLEKSPTYKYFNRIGLLTAPGKLSDGIEQETGVISILFGKFCSSYLETYAKNAQFSIQYSHTTVVCSDFQ